MTFSLPNVYNENKELRSQEELSELAFKLCGQIDEKSKEVERLKKITETPEFKMWEKELVRYKQDCRKKALEFAVAMIAGSQSGEISDTVTKEADKYYEWLIKEV